MLNGYIKPNGGTSGTCHWIIITKDERWSGRDRTNVKFYNIQKSGIQSNRKYQTGSQSRDFHHTLYTSYKSYTFVENTERQTSNRSEMNISKAFSHLYYRVCVNISFRLHFLGPFQFIFWSHTYVYIYVHESFIRRIGLPCHIPITWTKTLTKSGSGLEQVPCTPRRQMGRDCIWNSFSHE